MTSIPISMELFPPHTDKGMEKLQTAVNELQGLAPDYFSVTYGAGGSTHDPSFRVIDWLVKQKVSTTPHFTCIGAKAKTVDTILQRYIDQGINHIVALRGDLPLGTGYSEIDAFRYASDLVAYIRRTTGDHFHIEVAAYPEYHPQAATPQVDLEHFKLKVKAGANSAITQYFFNPDAYSRFIENCQKLAIDIPIVPGIMPITNAKQLIRFSDNCGAEIPRWIRLRLEAYGKDDMESLRAFGLDVVTQLCEQLISAGAPGLHFFTMNRSSSVKAICENLNL